MEENNNQNENLNNNSTVEQTPVVEPVVNQNTTTNNVEQVNTSTNPNTNTAANPNPYQTAPKPVNKNTGLIVGIIILILIIIGGGVYGFITINDLKKQNEEKDNQLSSKNVNDALGSLMDVFNKDDDKDDDDDEEDNKKPNTTKTENITKEDNDNKEDKSTTSSSSTDAKASTKENPLKLGEWGLAAKYVSKNLSKDYEGKSYIDVPVRVTQVTRGAEAETKVKEWFNSQTLYKYQNPKETTEWAIVDYEVDLSKVSFDEGTIGTSTEVSSAVKGLDGLGIKYNGVSYILSTTNTTTKDYVKKPGVYKCQFIVTLPEGCTDYLVVLGNSHNGAESYFKCEK